MKDQATWRLKRAHPQRSFFFQLVQVLYPTKTDELATYGSPFGWIKKDEIEEAGRSG